ncbi:MAG: DUF3829 domain-containing protein [Chthoniobacterales bacterium]
MNFFTLLRSSALVFLAPLALFAAPEKPATPPAMPDAEFQSLLLKTNLYTVALNAVSGAQQSYERYASWVNIKKGPTGKENYISYGLYEISDSSVKDVTKAAEKGPKMAPPLPALDAVVVRLASSYGALQPVVKKAHDYYEQEDYRDDGAKGAKEMHATMLPLFEATFAAEKELRRALGEVKAMVDQRQLEMIEKKAGKKYEWHLRSLLLAAKGLINLLPETANAPLIEREDYQKRYAEVETAYNAFENFCTENPEEVKKVLLASFVDTSVKDFFAASKFLRRTLEANKRDRREYLERVSDLAQKYNELIQRTNTMH